MAGLSFFTWATLSLRALKSLSLPYLTKLAVQETEAGNTELNALDGNVYDHLKDYLMVFSRTELEICQSVQSTFQFLLETSSRKTPSFTSPSPSSFSRATATP
ncbi:putative FCH and double SH3 domains protein [Naja naja]|nr:putative FCH and double SH3 domains protein [Naja naja]